MNIYSENNHSKDDDILTVNNNNNVLHLTNALCLRLYKPVISHNANAREIKSAFILLILQRETQTEHTAHDYTNVLAREIFLPESLALLLLLFQENFPLSYGWASKLFTRFCFDFSPPHPI